jgi:ATPase subunit of ABC transporter with duplicated ATPase domains
MNNCIMSGNRDEEFATDFYPGPDTTYYFNNSLLKTSRHNNEYFQNCDLNLVEWLSQFSNDHYEEYLRGWLGRMLFSGEEALKQAKVISGGEKVRCMLAKMMLEGSNFLIFDEPTNHLDLESITALNNGLSNYKGCMLLTSHDQELMNTVANRIIEIDETKVYDRQVTYDEYVEETNS